MRRLLAALMIALLAAVPAANAAPKRSCKALRGADLAPARDVKLVRVPNADDGTDLVGCVLPRGRVRTLAESADHFTTVVSYEVRQVAGSIVLLEHEGSSQYGASVSLNVADLRTGRRYAILTAGNHLGEAPLPPPPTPAIVNARGGAVAVFQDPHTVVITGFSPAGRRQILASAPAAQIAPESVRLAGTTVTWVQQGQPVSATLPG